MKKFLVIIASVAVFAGVIWLFYQKYTIQEKTMESPYEERDFVPNSSVNKDSIGLKHLSAEEIQKRVDDYNASGIDRTLSFLDNSTESKIIRHSRKLEDGDFVIGNESEVNLENEETLELINVLKTEKLKRLRLDPEMIAVSFCTFIPTYSLVFDLPSGKASFVMCFGCDEVYVQFKQDGETKKSDTYEFSKELKKKLATFFDELEWTSLEKEQ